MNQGTFTAILVGVFFLVCKYKYSLSYQLKPKEPLRGNIRKIQMEPKEPLKARLESMVHALTSQAEIAYDYSPDEPGKLASMLKNLEIAVRILKNWETIDTEIADSAEQILEKRLGKYNG
jgi:hypothetical protein